MNEWIAVYEIAVGDWFNKFNSLPKWISFLDFNPANFKTTAIQHSWNYYNSNSSESQGWFQIKKMKSDWRWS